MSASIMTPRLGLRRPRMSDLGRIVALLNDREIARNLSVAPHPYLEEHALGWLPSKCGETAPDNASFLVETPEDGVIGSVGFHPEHGEAEIGFWLARDFWGKGLMTEAAAAVIRWFFAASTADRMIAGFFADNPASWRVQEKLGFVRSGRSGVFSPPARSELVQSHGTVLTRLAFETRGGL